MASPTGPLPSLFTRLLGGRRTRRLARYQRLVDRICALEPSVQRRTAAGWDAQREAGRQLLLAAIDDLWTEHLTELERLEEGIGLRSYAEVDPVVAWRQEATGMWQELLRNIRVRFVHLWFRIEVRAG